MRRIASIGRPVKRAAAIGAVLLVSLAVLFLLVEGREGSDGKTYEIVFDNAFGLTEGGDFKVAGVRAGTTSQVEILEGRRPLALVTAEVTEAGFADLRRDAHCEIRPQSFIGEYFVDCQPGDSRARVPDGGRVPLDQTSSTIPVDLVNNVLRRPYRERLRIIIGELGAGFAGRSEDLSDALRRAHPGLRETNQTLRVLGRQTRTIRRFVRDADTVVGALARRRSDVSRFVGEAGRTAAITATRREELARTFDRLPEFLGELDPLMLRLGQVARAQQPVLEDLRGAAGDLDSFLALLPPFADEGRPAFAALGEATTVGRRAVRTTREELDELRRFARNLPGLAKPLRQLLVSLDDRERAVEPDARAAATDPPAPDKTHIASGRGGFTGMEAIWNYFFWQALTTNALDDVGHVLRLEVDIDTKCSAFIAARAGDEAEFDRCRQWLGPYQPGITAPDPTATAGAAGTEPEAPVASLIPLPAEPPASQSEPVLDFLLGP
jgi:virulence factor Mce-like protein